MNKNTIVGVIALLFGIAYTHQALQLPKAAIGNPLAPIYFPASLGILMSVLAIALIIKSRFSSGASGAKKAKDPGFLLLIGGTVALGILYANIFYKIGFIYSTMIFLGGILFLVNGIRGWKSNIAVTVVFTMSVWYVFQKLFLIQLP